jgi:hypothetical protein
MTSNFLYMVILIELYSILGYSVVLLNFGLHVLIICDNAYFDFIDQRQ